MKSQDSTTAAAPHRSLERIFASLPCLGSAEYLRFLRSATTAELPPEVLVRAYRRLVAEADPEPARATLERLLGEKNGGPEYLRPLLFLATRRVPPHQNWQEALDLYQDTVALILEVLPTGQGRFAERAWTSFCRQRLTDAWRRRQGRRGERLEPERYEPTGEAPDPFDRHVERPPWHAMVEPDRLPWLEDFLDRTVERIRDPFVRGVARDQWLSDTPSPISGRSNGRQPLTERFEKSRFQVYRALDSARASILAALEVQSEIELDVDRFLGKAALPRSSSREVKT